MHVPQPRVDTDAHPHLHTSAWITLHRTAPDDVKERELYVSVDGRRLGVLTYGDEGTLAIAPGHHELRVHNTLSHKRIAFEAQPGQHLRFAVANIPGRGFAYWAFFLGAALMWTRVEREDDVPPPSGPVQEHFRR